MLRSWRSQGTRSPALWCPCPRALPEKPPCGGATSELWVHLGDSRLPAASSPGPQVSNASGSWETRGASARDASCFLSTSSQAAGILVPLTQEHWPEIKAQTPASGSSSPGRPRLPKSQPPWYPRGWWVPVPPAGGRHWRNGPNGVLRSERARRIPRSHSKEATARMAPGSCHLPRASQMGTRLESSSYGWWLPLGVACSLAALVLQEQKVPPLPASPRVSQLLMGDKNLAPARALRASW